MSFIDKLLNLLFCYSRHAQPY